MSKKENSEAKLARLRSMSVDDGGTWDLSGNDQAAIKFALDMINKLADVLSGITSVPARYIITGNGIELDKLESQP